MINFGGAECQMYLGDTLLDAVYLDGVKVWPDVKVAWIKGFTDQSYLFQPGINWIMNTPDLSSKPKPFKGCLILNPYVDITQNLSANIVVHDGTDWQSSIDSVSGTYTMPSATSGKIPRVRGWWNGPTAATDIDNFMNSEYSPGELWMLAGAAPDGIHIRLVDNNGGFKDFTDPYPAGVTMADMPPTETDSSILNS